MRYLLRRVQKRGYILIRGRKGELEMLLHWKMNNPLINAIKFMQYMRSEVVLIPSAEDLDNFIMIRVPDSWKKAGFRDGYDLICPNCIFGYIFLEKELKFKSSRYFFLLKVKRKEKINCWVRIQPSKKKSKITGLSAMY